jgi:DNA-binding MarR family transcriptional regulator
MPKGGPVLRPRSPSRRSSDDQRAITAVRRLVRSLRLATAEVHRRTGISGAQLFVLRSLADHPGQSMGDLLASTLTTQSTVSEVVARLVDAGLVARETAADDRRRSILTPTAAGRTLIRAAPPAVQADLVAALRRLPPATRRALADGLEQWLAAAGVEEHAAPMFFEPTRESKDARATR